MFTNSRFIVLAALCLIALAPVTAVRAEDAAAEDVVRCISISRISSTQVLDDHNVLFRMRGGTMYRNELPHRCPGLRHEKKFMYRTSLAQLCDLDVITVLHDHGSGFTPGPSCGLGRFHAITKDELAAFRKAARNPEPATEEPKGAEPEEID